MAQNKYQTKRVAARFLTVGTVTYRHGEIVAIRPHRGTGRIYTFRDGREWYFDYPERVRIYPSL